MPENSVAPQRESFLSRKDIPAAERLILALDVPSAEDAKALVEQLGDTVVFYKLGLELLLADGYFDLVKWLRDRGKKVFADIKIFDVPETVSSSVRQLSKHGVSFATVHGNDSILRAACGQKNGIKVLAVTVLTSLDEGDMQDLGFRVPIEDVVLSRARRALEIGCDGVISSGIEAPALRRESGEGFVIVVPGVRPGTNDIPDDDQKRVVNVVEAFLNGADYIVVGRPIRTADDPKAAAEEIQREIAALPFGE